MAEAEYAGLGGFFSRAGSALLQRGQQREQEQARKHELWITCIMKGGSVEGCSQILDYDPGERGRAGAESIEARRRMAEERERAEKLAEEERKEVAELTPEEQALARSRTALGLPLSLRTRTPTGEPTRVPIGKTPDVSITGMPDVGIRPDWRSVIGKARTEKEVAERRGEISRDIAEEERKTAADIATEGRTAKAKRAFELWKKEQGIGVKETEVPEDRIRKLWEKHVDNVNDINIKNKADPVLKFTYEPAEALAFDDFKALFKESGEQGIYNRCRDAGGTMEQCKIEAGIE